MSSPGHEIKFYLADWHVDTATNTLRQGKTIVKLESKVMAVLQYLAQHDAHVIAREELERAVWGNTVIGYDALTSSIAKLRKALGDDTRQPRYIETIAKKGYRLIVSPTIEFPLADNNAQPEIKRDSLTNQNYRRFAWVVAPSLIAIILLFIGIYHLFTNTYLTDNRNFNNDQPSIVILPFTNLSDNPSHKYFSDGVTADITTALSKLSGLFVISQSSALGYQEQAPDVKNIAESLNVRYILQGSIRRTDNRMRVNANLIDAHSNIYIWSEKYDRELNSIFEIQDDITDNIVDSLSIKLTEAEQRRTARKYTVDFEAYEYFLRGQSLYAHLTREDNQSAQEYYRRAIDRDPQFARAYSALAMTYAAAYRYGWGNSTGGQLDQALQFATSGVTLNDELPQAHWVLGYVYLFRKNYKKANEAAGRAIALDPNYADSYLMLAMCRIHFGAPEEALQLVRKAMQLNPEYPTPYASILGQSYYFLGQYKNAIPVLRDAIERNQNLLAPHVFLIVALSKLNMMDEAGWAAEELQSVVPDFNLTKVAELLPIQDVDTIKDMITHLRRAGL